MGCITPWKHGLLYVSSLTHAMLNPEALYAHSLIALVILHVLVLVFMQLRGRVGRADKEAHAYLFYPEKNILTDEALVTCWSLTTCLCLHFVLLYLFTIDIRTLLKLQNCLP